MITKRKKLSHKIQYIADIKYIIYNKPPIHVQYEINKIFLQMQYFRHLNKCACLLACASVIVCISSQRLPNVAHWTYSIFDSTISSSYLSSTDSEDMIAKSKTKSLRTVTFTFQTIFNKKEICHFTIDNNIETSSSIFLLQT